jgi:diguanylate cyclase (GGDEF)-like protein
MRKVDFEMYQKTTEKVKDGIMEENLRLTRMLAEKEQSFELVKLVHFDKNIDLKTLNDIIIGCTGCLHSIMLYHNQVITNMDKESELYLRIMDNKDELTSSKELLLAEDLIDDYTIITYPVSTSDMLQDSKRFVKNIIMVYPNRYMNREVLSFVKSFMIVNEVLINIVLTRAKMIELIETDPMTKALNRSSWTDNLSDIVSNGVPFFILFFDLDNFKHINDTYGHTKGDEILKFCSNWLRNTFRSDDRIFRLGGDEFAVTGNINIEHIDGFIHKFDQLTQSFKNNVNELYSIDASVSIGALLSSKKYTHEEVYNKVDELLYKSKEDGRNKLTLLLDI